MTPAGASLTMYREIRSYANSIWDDNNNNRPALRVRIVENTSRLDVRTFLCINVLCRVTIKSRVWINRVKLPILLAVSCTGKLNISLSPFAPENLVSRDGFSRLVPSRASLLIFHTPRALSLRNLVSGFECGRVFQAGVGPGSPSRDVANWLPLRFGLSVETRRWYGWVRMVFLGVRLFRAPIWCPSGGWRHARGREHCRGEPGSVLSGGYAPDSTKAEGSSIVDEPGEG